MNLKQKIIIFLLLISPSFVMAFNVYPESGVRELGVGERTQIKIFINTNNDEVNTIEGQISADPELGLSGVNTGGSILVLWPEKPIIKENNIKFVGGSYSGFYGKDLRLLNLIFTPKSEGVFNLNINNLGAYLSDGKGTKLSGEEEIFKFNVIKKDNSQSNNEEDRIPPSNLSIDIGKDSSLFGGKYFITFNALDNLSGINKFEIKEGDSSFEIYNDQSYIIKDQSLRTNIWVRVTDNNGNEIMKSFKPIDLLDGKESNSIKNYIIVISILIILFIYGIVYYLFINKRNKNVKKN